jgi:hypothetical protein
MGVVTDMLKKRKEAGVTPIGVITTDKFSKPAMEKLKRMGIACAEIPEREIRNSENREMER